MLYCNNTVNSFSSVFNQNPPDNVLNHQTCSSFIPDLSITPDITFKALSSLDPNASMGEDPLHPRLLKLLAGELSFPLTIIFNASLRSGQLPALWLSSIIIPIFKKGSKFDPLNYRPISLTSSCCKVLERIIAAHLNKFLDEHCLISTEQFGFRAGCSTVDQLLLTYNDVTQMLDHRETIDLIFFDFQKAFDVVNHQILLQKLSCLGVCGNLLNWIQYFISNRSMYVRVQDTSSHLVPVLSGVPQGSVLGPIMFLIFINHIVSDLSCSYKIFADDIKIYLSGPVESYVSGSQISNIQHNINKLVNTGNSWGLRLNSGKCKVLRFSSRNSPLPTEGISPYTIDGEAINFTPSHLDLGVKIDHSLRFHSHIHNKTTLVNALMTNLLRCTLSREPQFMLPIFTSILRPQLEYASPLWNLNYIGDTKLLERVQRRWTREIRGLEREPYHQRLQQLNLFSVQGRLLRADLILIWKIFNGQSGIKPHQLFHIQDSVTRGHPLKIQHQYTRLDLRHRFFSIRVVNFWNNLSIETVLAQTVESFKSGLVRDLGAVLFEYHL